MAISQVIKWRNDINISETHYTPKKKNQQKRNTITFEKNK